MTEFSWAVHLEARYVIRLRCMAQGREMGRDEFMDLWRRKRGM
jgi:hypothetical protein